MYIHILFLFVCAKHYSFKFSINRNIVHIFNMYYTMPIDIYLDSTLLLRLQTTPHKFCGTQFCPCSSSLTAVWEFASSCANKKSLLSVEEWFPWHHCCLQMALIACHFLSLNTHFQSVLTQFTYIFSKNFIKYLSCQVQVFFCLPHLQRLCVYLRR